jgi:hypothetical protein
MRFLLFDTFYLNSISPDATKTKTIFYYSSGYPGPWISAERKTTYLLVLLYLLIKKEYLDYPAQMRLYYGV